MKNYIKSFALLLLCTISFVACTEDTSYDDYDGITYPEKITLGSWTCQSSEAEKFDVTITVNAVGDTVCNVLYTTPVQQMEMSAGVLTNYDAVSGMAEFDFGNSLWGTPGVLYAYYGLDKSSVKFCLFPVVQGQRYDSYRIDIIGDKVAFPPIFGYWVGMAGESILEFIVNGDGSCSYAVGDVYIEDGISSTSNGVTTLKPLSAEDGASVVTIRTNELFQMVATVSGVEGVAETTQFIMDKQ
ncbi:MAG: hypothetical protein IKU63_08010 [Bacteroidaceae bacterium]|nr:hypothetical protein [Bacteroidaceae bacterium]